jgi:hypothetical protein
MAATRIVAPVRRPSSAYRFRTIRSTTSASSAYTFASVNASRHPRANLSTSGVTHGNGRRIVFGRGSQIVTSAATASVRGSHDAARTADSAAARTAERHGRQCVAHLDEDDALAADERLLRALRRGGAVDADDELGGHVDALHAGQRPTRNSWSAPHRF